jgi:hypothetical protein
MASIGHRTGLFDALRGPGRGGEGLGAMWGEEKAREYLIKAGFRSIQTNQLAHDIQNNWYVIRK